MATKYKVDKDKCIACGVCISTCPEGLDWDEDGKSKVINSEEVEKGGGETLCPYEAIVKVEVEE